MIRQVMEGAHLTLWPILSLLLFTLSTVVMLIWMFRPGSKRFYTKLSYMVLSDIQMPPSKDELEKGNLI